MIFEEHKKSVEFFRTRFVFEIPGIYHRHWPVTEIDGGIVHRGIFYNPQVQFSRQREQDRSALTG